MATLRVYRGDQLVVPFELGQGRTRIGRGTENQLVLEDRDKQVSRIHAEIWHERGQFFIADLNSQNGVWIGERQIRGEEALPVNVPVAIGPYRLILIAEEPPAASEAAETLRQADAYVEPTQLVDGLTVPPPSASPPAQPAAAAPMPALAKATTSGSQPAAATVPPPAARTQRPESATLPSPSSKRNTAALAGILVAAVVVAIAAWFVLGRSGGSEGTVATTNPEPTVPSSTTSSVPAGPTPEDVFQQHFMRAQTLIAENNKAGAREANTAALTALPDDPRAVAQRTAIDAMPDVPATTAATTAPVPAAGAAPPGTVAATPPLAGPETLRVAPRAGESAVQRATREKLAKTHLDDGKKALAEARYVQAIDLLQAALNQSGRQDYGTSPNEAVTALARARKERAAAEAAQRGNNARRLVEEARALGSGDVVNAIGKVREARNLDPDVEGANDLLNALQEQARVQGEKVLGSAKNLDNRPNRREEALREYERAVALLELVPNGHKDLALARQRVAELKAQ